MNDASTLAINLKRQSELGTASNVYISTEQAVRNKKSEDLAMM